MLEEEAMGEIDTIEGLIQLFRDNLQKKRYEIVFADVWQKDFWEVINHAFPSSSKSDRIIITTRNTSIAYSIKETSLDLVQELKPWSWNPLENYFAKRHFLLSLRNAVPKC